MYHEYRFIILYFDGFRRRHVEQREEKKSWEIELKASISIRFIILRVYASLG